MGYTVYLSDKNGEVLHANRKHNVKGSTYCLGGQTEPTGNKWLADGKLHKNDEGNYIYEVEILEMSPDIRKYF